MKIVFSILVFWSSASAAQSNRVLENAFAHKVICLDSSCPAGLGTVLSTGIFGDEFCQASVVDANTVMTNSHCVERYLESKNCEGEVYFKFGNTVAECKEIVFTAYDKNDLNKPDVAIIKLKKPIDTPPINFKRSSFKNEESYYFYKSKLNFSDNSSQLKKVACKAKQNSIAAGSFFTSKPKTISLADCHFEDGDSGSLIFNTNNEAVAILQGGLPSDALEIFSKMKLKNFNDRSYIDVLKSYSIESDQQFQTVIAATTMTCLDTPYIKGKVDCSPATVKDYLASELTKAYNSFSAQLHRADGEFVLSFSEYLAVTQAEDVKVPELQPKDFQSYFLPGTMNCKLATHVPAQIVTMRGDQYFRLIVDLQYARIPLSQGIRNTQGYTFNINGQKLSIQCN